MKATSGILRKQPFLVTQLKAKKFDDEIGVTAGKSILEILQDADKTADVAEETDKVDLQEGLRVKLKEEISSPFRKVRQFIYTGMGIAGALGTVTAVPQLLFAVQDGGCSYRGCGECCN